MSYKTIMAYVPSEKVGERVLDCALPIARENDAHLIGLHVLPRVPATFGMIAAEIPQLVVRQQEELLAQRAEQIKEAFLSRCEKAGVKAEWRSAKPTSSNPASEISSQALCCDLIVLSQQEDDPTNSADDLPSRIVMDTGRPALVIPHAGAFNEVGKRVVVAWNGSREAARSALYAVPMMRNAQSVRVLAIDPQCREGYDSIALGDEMALCLARHDIKAEVTVTRTDGISVGDELLNRLADDGCDLLVMGCYGHSRLRETLFGGVTQNLLQHMTAPVLMSH